MKRLGMAVSDDTILRRLKSTARVPSKELRVVGIDDWARKKGQNYGTILVDLDSRTVHWPRGELWHWRRRPGGERLKWSRAVNVRRE